MSSNVASGEGGYTTSTIIVNQGWGINFWDHKSRARVILLEHSNRLITCRSYTEEKNDIFVFAVITKKILYSIFPFDEEFSRTII